MSQRTLKQRLEWLYERKPVPTIEVYLDLVGRELFELCQALPFEPGDLGFDDLQLQRRIEPVLDQMHPASAELMLVLCDLLDWELEFEVERVDHYMRNKLYARAAPTHLEVETLHFLHQLLLEVLLWRKEDSARSIKRADLHRAVGSLRLLARALA
ncbi:MAG: hypothetical protein ABIJ09_01305 [Pseudomonadota bacterium]